MNNGLTEDDFEIKFNHYDNLVIEIGEYLSSDELDKLKQQILDNQAIVDGLHSFIRHCQAMIDSLTSQLEDDNSDINEEFCTTELARWHEKQNDLVELIHFRTKNMGELKTEESILQSILQKTVHSDGTGGKN